MISIRNLTKYYDSHCAVDGVSVDIAAGQIVGLLGPNGAGKTTTMRILTCHLQPSDGTILVGDLDVREEPLEVKRMIGYLPESAPLYPDMLTYDLLLYVAAVRGIPKALRPRRIEELTALCGLEEVMHKSIKELSRGYKQRVGLAHAMMGDPEILVLDEPTAGLDPNQIVQIREIIKRMGREKTVILSTHILSEAEATCDRIVIINRGKIVADGTPETLGAAGLQSQVVRLTVVGVEPSELDERLRAVTGVKNVVLEAPEAGSGEIRAQAYCDGDLRIPLYRAVKAEEWDLVELTRERQSLEETFRELTLTEKEE